MVNKKFKIGDLKDIEGCYPQLFFNEIPTNEEKVYSLLVHDVFNPEEVKFSTYNTYWVYVAELQDGFAELGYDLTYRYLFHFPSQAFAIAWKNKPRRETVINGNVYDCIIAFKRVTKKKIIIMDRQLIEVIITHENKV